MFRQFLVFLGCVLINIIYTNGQGSYYDGYNFNYNNLYKQITSGNSGSGYWDQTSYGNGLVSISLYYEALCKGCKVFDTTVLRETVLELGQQLDIHLVPYGNAKTIQNLYGGVDFISQHGPAETYGNKLHACAIDIVQNKTMSVLFNSCLMEQGAQGSDDAAADVCGSYLRINSESIKQCAKGVRGIQLLKQHGEESKAVGFKTVPTILVNGLLSSPERFKEDVYKALGRVVGNNLKK